MLYHAPLAVAVVSAVRLPEMVTDGTPLPDGTKLAPEGMAVPDGAKPLMPPLGNVPLPPIVEFPPIPPPPPMEFALATPPLEVKVAAALIE